MGKMALRMCCVPTVLRSYKKLRTGRIHDLFMSPIFGEHVAVGMVLWRFAAFLEVMLLGGVWSVVRFAKRSARG